MGVKNFPLTYFETDAGFAIYRTAVLISADRVTAAGTITGVNVQLQDSTWAGHTDQKRVLKSVNKAQLGVLARGGIDARVPKQFRTDADKTGGLFQPAGFWKGTSTPGTTTTDVIYFEFTSGQ